MENVLARARELLQARGDSLAAPACRVIDAVTALWREVQGDEAARLTLSDSTHHEIACDVLEIGTGLATATRLLLFFGGAFETTRGVPDVSIASAIAEARQWLSSSQPVHPWWAAVHTHLTQLANGFEALEMSIAKDIEIFVEGDALLNAASYRRATEALQRVAPSIPKLARTINVVSLHAPPEQS